MKTKMQPYFEILNERDFIYCNLIQINAVLNTFLMGQIWKEQHHRLSISVITSQSVWLFNTVGESIKLKMFCLDRINNYISGNKQTLSLVPPMQRFNWKWGTT